MTASAEDLAARIAGAAAGATIDLGEGTWPLDGEIVVERELTLRGAGPERSVVRGESSDDWIVVKAGAIRIRRGTVSESELFDLHAEANASVTAIGVFGVTKINCADDAKLAQKKR